MYDAAAPWPRPDRLASPHLSPMPTAVLRPLSELAHRLPAACGLSSATAGVQGTAERATALHIVGDLQVPNLLLSALPERGAPLPSWLAGLWEAAARAPWQQRPCLVVIEGHLQVDGLLTHVPDADAPAPQPAPPLVVTGNLTAHGVVLGGPPLCVQGAVAVAELLWGGPEGTLWVGGRLQARVALFTGQFALHAQGPVEAEWLLDETSSSGTSAEAEAFADAVAQVFLLDCLLSPLAGHSGIGGLLHLSRVAAALQRGQPVAHGSDVLRALYPVADDLCPGGQMSAENLLAVLRSPVVGHREFVATGWFGQTDFALCRRHVDADGDRRDDSLYITVWKTWDFHLSVEAPPAERSPWARWVAKLRGGGPEPSAPALTLLYRPYHRGEPGEWALLDAHAPESAWSACQQAWQRVLDYARKAIGQHRARYPLHALLTRELSASCIEALARLPVFTDEYNDWWDSERNGFWLGDVWVGARQPCMHEGQPWPLALKLSWKNGSDAAGDAPDDAHAAYQLDVDEARQGPPVVAVRYAQRQSGEREPLPRGAADHIARLLRMYGWVSARLLAPGREEPGNAAAVYGPAADDVPCRTAPPRSPEQGGPHGQR